MSGNDIRNLQSPLQWNGTAISLRLRPIALPSETWVPAPSSLPETLVSEFKKQKLGRFSDGKSMEQTGSGRPSPLERLAAGSFDSGASRVMTEDLYRWLSARVKDRAVRRLKRRYLRILFSKISGDAPQKPPREMRYYLSRISPPSNFDQFELAWFWLLWRQTLHQAWSLPPPNLDHLLASPLGIPGVRVASQASPDGSLHLVSREEADFLSRLLLPMGLAQFQESCLELCNRANSRLLPSDPAFLRACRLAVATRKSFTSPSAVLRRRLSRRVRTAAACVVPALLLDRWDILVFPSPSAWLMSQADLQSELFSGLVQLGVVRGGEFRDWTPDLMVDTKRSPVWPRRHRDDVVAMPVSMAMALLSACRRSSGPDSRSVELSVLEELERLVSRCWTDEATLSLIMGKTSGKLDRLAVRQGLRKRQFLSPHAQDLIYFLLQGDQLYLLIQVTMAFRFLVLSAQSQPRIPAQQLLKQLDCNFQAGVDDIATARMVVAAAKIVPEFPPPADSPVFSLISQQLEADEAASRQ